MITGLFHNARQRQNEDNSSIEFPEIIELDDVVKVFKTPSGDFTALKGVSISFNQGEFIGVTGKSGSGKSTLINMITGIDRPTSGNIRIGNTILNKLTESQMAMWRGRNLGIVFQFYQLLPMLSLLENTMLPMDFCNVYPPAERETRAMELLSRVGLDDVVHKLPAAVSGGQQQAAAIARAMANNPNYLIADEPTGNLDSKTAESIFEIFEDLSVQGKTVIMITHDPDLSNRTQRQIILCDGEIIAEPIHRAFPMLSHRQMLVATHAVQPQSFPANTEVFRDGDAGNSFQLIIKGEAEITYNNENRQETLSLKPGQYWGDNLQFLKIFSKLISVRAGKNGLETLSLDTDIIKKLATESIPFNKLLATSLMNRHTTSESPE